jgi:hypothetical protein
MRAVTADESLFLEPTALIFLNKTGDNGFIVKEKNDVIFGKEGTAEILIVVRKYTTANAEKTQKLLNVLNRLAQKAWQLDGVLSYAPLARRDNLKTEISVLERYGSTGAFYRAEELLNPQRYESIEIENVMYFTLELMANIDLKRRAYLWVWIHRSGKMALGIFAGGDSDLSIPKDWLPQRNSCISINSLFSGL